MFQGIFSAILYLFAAMRRLQLNSFTYLVLESDCLIDSGIIYSCFVMSLKSFNGWTSYATASFPQSFSHKKLMIIAADLEYVWLCVLSEPSDPLLQRLDVKQRNFNPTPQLPYLRFSNKPASCICLFSFTKPSRACP